MPFGNNFGNNFGFEFTTTVAKSKKVTATDTEHGVTYRGK